jgi:hypothetical protein
MPLTRIKSLGITDGTIVNADINASAAIAGTKLSGAGKVLQVVTATDATERTTTSTSFVTGSNTLSVSITPSSASNKIFIIVSTVIRSVAADGACQATIYRGATNLAGAGGFTGHYSTIAYANVPATMSYLDSPSTTSATTYQVYFKAGSGEVALQSLAASGNGTGTITAFEIAG